MRTRTAVLRTTVLRTTVLRTTVLRTAVLRTAILRIAVLRSTVSRAAVCATLLLLGAAACTGGKAAPAEASEDAAPAQAAHAVQAVQAENPSPASEPAPASAPASSTVSGTAPSGGGPAAVGGAAGANPRQAQVGDLTLRLSGCDFSDGTVTCALMVTSSGAASDIELHRERAVMPDGRELIASQHSLGATFNNFNYLTYRLLADTPTRGEIQFDNVPSSYDRFTVLEIPVNDRSVVFREVPFHGG